MMARLLVMAGFDTDITRTAVAVFPGIWLS
jgi:hypothetical protein